MSYCIIVFDLAMSAAHLDWLIFGIRGSLAALSPRRPWWILDMAMLDVVAAVLLCFKNSCPNILAAAAACSYPFGLLAFPMRSQSLLFLDLACILSQVSGRTVD